MNKHLQEILNLIQQGDMLSAEQKAAVLKSLKNADKELEITTFKLDRTEKVKRTTAILLEETIEELEQKRKAVEAQNKELEIEAALEKVRSKSLSMYTSGELNEVVGALFERLKELNIPVTSASINIYIEGSKDLDVFVCGQNENELIIHNYILPWFDHPIVNDLYAARNSGLDFVKDEYSIEEKDSFYSYLFEKTELRQLPDGIKNLIFQSQRYSISMAITKNSMLVINDFEQKSLSQKETDILKRFAKAFEQAYIRFLDLQKSEAQARESQIQLALERVRARTMAMQKSDELHEVAAILFQQVNELGIKPWTTGFNVWSDDNNTYEDYITNPQGGFIEPYLIDATKYSVFTEVSNAKKNGETFYVQFVGGERLQKTYEYLNEFANKGQFENILDSGFEFPLHQYDHFVFGQKASLMFITYEPVPEAHDIFKRFGKTFEQTYTRFLDLQTAETQVREAKIEAALERTRTQSMIMQHSKELDDTLRVFHEQILLLGIPSAFSFLWLPDEAKDRHIFWAAWAENNSSVFNSKSINYPLDRNEPATAQCLIDWKADEPVVSYHVPPPSVNDYFAAWSELIAGVDELKPENFSGGLYYVEAFMKYGCFGVIVKNGLHEDEKKILGRFAIEFERTYTRFLDLQKAEAQTREAQIEAALERVRSRTMGMQKSEELKEIISVVYEQFVYLNILIEHAGFIIDYKARNDMSIWLADKHLVPSQITIPYFDSPHWNSFNEAKKTGSEFFANNLAFDIKNKFYTDLFAFIPDVPDETKEYYLSCPGVAISTVLLDNVGLYIENFSGIPYSEVENATLLRFGKVFQQTYTRFLDLQRAEAQALEAIKRASVDRVRADIASMRTPDDLQRIQPLIWNELTTLGIPFIRCGVFIMDEEHQLVHTFLSTPEGKAIATLHVPFEFNLSIITNGVSHWRSKKMYQEYWDAAAFSKSWIALSSLSERPGDSHQQEQPPENLYLHMLPFVQGMLYVGNDRPLTEVDLQLVQNLADAFATAYARYEDFNKLESANVKIERTLVDLKQAQAQLVQSEKMASLGELTAGIAHEIQNPLNFVNNFSEVNAELIDELRNEFRLGNVEEAMLIIKDIALNEQKINQHGKRADAIVKGMLQHSRTTSTTKEATDINALVDEYLRLAYHGLRAKDKNFNATMKTDYDETIGNVKIIPQDIGRVILNVITNAFYAVNEKKKNSVKGNTSVERPATLYEPTVSISTKRIAGNLEIAVKDNGTGIPPKIVDKIFQPFFTTKPTGQGTGLGLSLAYDIVKTHGGTLHVKTKEGEGSEFIIKLSIG